MQGERPNTTEKESRKPIVVALLGSPRRQGNTDLMADAVLAGAKEAGGLTSKVYLDEYLVRPLGEVADNSRNRDDLRSDDDFPALLARFLDADIIIWSTPVYWYGVSAQLKCFLDRLSPYYHHPGYTHRILGKGHVVLCAFGSPEHDHGEWITRPMKLTVEVLQGRYLGDVCVSAYEKGKVREVPSVLARCRELGTYAVRQFHIWANRNEL